MATLVGTQYGSLYDIATRTGPDGTYQQVIEMLELNCPFMRDAPFFPTNDTDTHVSTRRTALPETARRRVNQGVAPTKSSTVQVRDATCQRESQIQIDEMIAEREGANFAKHRLNEVKAHVMAMSQDIEEDMLYGDEATDPENMTGFMPRYSDPTSEFGGNVIDAGSSDTDNTSILLVGWGENTCHGIYPKDTVAGITQKDHGLQRVSDANNYNYWAYVYQVKARYGLSIPDPRAVVRIGSIEISALSDVTPTEGSSLFDLMIKAMTQADQPGMGQVNYCFYAPQIIFQRLLQQAHWKANADLTYEQAHVGRGSFQKTVMNPVFMGVPIKRADKILLTETAV